MDAVAAVVHARRVVAVEGEAGNDVGVEAVCAGRDADVLVRSRLDGSGAEGRDHRSLDAAAELRRRHRLGDGRVAELGRRHPGGVAPAVDLDRLVPLDGDVDVGIAADVRVVGVRALGVDANALGQVARGGDGVADALLRAITFLLLGRRSRT